MKIELEVTNDQLRDLKEVLAPVVVYSPTVTGDSSVAAEKWRQRDSIKAIFDQLPEPSDG
jgi:hypothetical protein